MMADKVTSSQVAERAGVSRSAVSRVFTPGASVSPGTAEKVQRAAEELGYRPNALARSLLTGRSRMIGLVVSYLDNHFYPGILERLSRALQDEGYHILMFMAGPESAEASAIVQEILDYQVDGLVLASVELSSDLAVRCRAMGVPVVLLNRHQGTPDEIAAVSDNFEGGRLAARHLLARGCSRIAHIAGLEGASTQQEREAG
ncbi:MAG: LacI family DNA-binding transcriptional regulator, partial [Pseudomonadota bacterium]